MLGPLNVIRGRRNPVSFDLRRDLGIWSGVMALLHAAVGLNVHLRERPWLYFVDQKRRVRFDLFASRTTQASSQFSYFSSVAGNLK